MKIKTLAAAAGAVLLILFLASITGSLIAPQDERCNTCMRMMVAEYQMDLRDSLVIVYKCPDEECDQRGQRTKWHDGRSEWTEW